MGIKLEVGKRYRDGYGKPRAIVMRFSASVYMAHDGAKYSDTGKRLVEYEYDSRFDLIALAPDEAPEPQPDELAALRARVAELEQEIVAHDHTIAEIGERAATLRARLTEAEESADLHFCRAERAEAENARLREALQFAVNQMRTVRDGKTGGIPNDIIALLPEAIEMADIALAKLRGTK
jgi:hypothetical protein